MSNLECLSLHFYFMRDLYVNMYLCNFSLKCLPSVHVALANFLFLLFLFISHNCFVFLSSKYELVISFPISIYISMIILFKFTASYDI